MNKTAIVNLKDAQVIEKNDEIDFEAQRDDFLHPLINVSSLTDPSDGGKVLHLNKRNA